MLTSAGLVATLALLIVLAEVLTRREPFRHLGAALVVILLAAVAANLGLIPAGSSEAAPTPVYDAIFETVAPVALFWLLLSVNLRQVLKAGLPLVGLFVLGAVGTCAGVAAGMAAVDGAASIGPLYKGVAGMFAGTYTGGSVNFNALALEYGVMREATLYTGAVVVDNIITTLWMGATLTAPRLFAAWWSRRSGRPAPGAERSSQPIIELPAETEALTPRSLATVVALGLGALVVSQWLSSALAARGLYGPVILVITVLALVLAQIRAVHHLPGARLLGMAGVYLFLAVIGAFCDLRALAGLGSLGPVLLAFAAVTVLVHGVVTFGAAWLLRIDLDGAAVASQANVGGSTSALALAKSLGREDLLVPGILLGALGNAIGTFLGFAVAGLV